MRWLRVWFSTLLVGFNQGVGIVALVPLLQMFEKNTYDEGNVIMRILHSITVITGVTISLESILLFYLSIMIVNSLLTYFSSIWQNDLQLDYTAEERTDIFGKLVDSQWTFLKGKGRNEFLHLLTSEVPKLTTMCYHLISITCSFIILAVFLSFAFMLSVSFTLLVSTCGILLFVVMSRFLKRIYSYSFSNLSTNRNFFKQIENYWDVIKLAKVHGTEEMHKVRFLKVNKAFVAERKMLIKTRSLSQVIFRLSAVSFICTVVYLGFQFGSVSLSSLLILIFLFARIFPHFQKIQNDLQQVVSLFPSIESIEITKVELNKNNVASDYNGSKQSVTLLEGIEMECLGFVYANTKTIFENLSLFIPARKLTGIVGLSGSGKTTLLDLITGILQPTNGDVKVDGISLASINRNKWCKTIAYVSQDTVFINGSLRDNLIWENKEISDERIFNILKKVNAFEFVVGLKNGLDTMMINNGGHFSGGERQRLALARALLRSPKLLLLDEVSSALDSSNEKIVLDILSSLKHEVTIVFITHSIEAKHYFDELIDLDSCQQKKVIVNV